MISLLPGRTSSHVDAVVPGRRARAAARRRRRAGAVAAVAAPTALFALHALGYGRWIVDDAAITFAYARSVAAGAGPVLQPGADGVEGYSNPAWLALLVAGRWLGLFDTGSWWGVPDVVAFPKLLGLFCAAVVFACFYGIARALTPRPALVAGAAGVALACVPSFVIWVVSGLENGLLAVAAAAIGAVLARAAAAGRLLGAGPAVAVGLLAALAALTRPDGLIYAGAYPLAVLVFLRGGQLARAVAMVVVSSAAFAVPVGLYLGWRVATFGEVLPNTALAKSQGLPGLAALERPAELIDHLGWLAVLVVVGVLACALARPWPGRGGLVVLLVPLALAAAAFAVLEPDWMGQFRFATPVWTLLAITGAVSFARALPMLARRGQLVVVGIAVLAAVVSGMALVDGARMFRAAPTVPVCLVATVGTAVEGYADRLGVRAGTVLAPDIGGLAMTTRLQVVDLVGLADADVARYWAADDMAGLRDYVFDEVRPTLVVSHSTWSTSTGLVDDPRLDRDYVLITSTGDGGHWARRDVVESPAALAAAQVFAAAVALPSDSAARRSPRASCSLR